MDQFVCGQRRRAEDCELSSPRRQGCPYSPFQIGGTGSKREDHFLTVFMEKEEPGRNSLLFALQVRTVSRTSWSATHP